MNFVKTRSLSLTGRALVLKVLSNDKQHFDPDLIGGRCPDDDVCCYVYAYVSLTAYKSQGSKPKI